MVPPIADACQVWPRAQIPANFHVPFRSEKPVLLISGKLDPVTPDRWGAEAAKNLPNSRQVVVKKGAHSFNQMSGCVEKLIAAFIQDGTGFNLDDSCTNKIQRPPFVFGQ
jgi:pimeloyl-ACP methyl ester carboxylesterase